MIGARLSNWIVDAEVSQNEMGRLLRAHAVDDAGKQVAIKWLTHAKSKAPEFEKLFLAQVDLLCKLRHPGIVAVVAGDRHEGSPYYVMDWVTGSDFQTILRGGARPAWTDALTIALQIVPALRHAHRRSVLHRDLKPSNLFRCLDGSYKLSDFGVTKFFGDVLLTNADNPLGSAAFISPEQAAGKPHTKRSDFYALGCLLYTLIVGRPPFSGATVVELIQKHCFVLPERPIHFVRDLPEEIDRFVMKLLVKEPAQRRSGTLLIQELEGIWSALERRGQVGKRPALPAAVDNDNDAPADDEPVLPPRLPAPIHHASIPWRNRWYVVGPLFVACVLLLLWAFYWRGATAEELMFRARPLLESDRPADWEKAWTDYLEPLSRKYPGAYHEEVNEAKRRIDHQGELQRAFLAGAAVRYRSQAERFYHEGLQLVQAGEFAAARRVWENLVKAYAFADDDRRWVTLANEGIERLNALEQSNPRLAGVERLEDALAPMIGEVQRLRQNGQAKEADALAQALEFLYRDDPGIEKLRLALGSVKK